MEKNVSLMTEAYAMVDMTLTYGFISAITFEPEKDEFYYTFKVGKCDNAKDYTLRQDAEFYASEADFKNGKPIKPDGEVLRSSCNGIEDAEPFNRYYLERYKMVNYEPTLIRLYVKKLVFGLGPREFTFEGDGNLTNTWRTREECLAWNEYYVKDENGVCHTRIGYKKLTTLTEDQKKMVDEFKAMAERMKGAGIGIIFDAEDCRLGFTNVSNFDNWSFGPENYSDCVHEITDCPNTMWTDIVNGTRYYHDYFYYTLKGEKKEE